MLWVTYDMGTFICMVTSTNDDDANTLGVNVNSIIRWYDDDDDDDDDDDGDDDDDDDGSYNETLSYIDWRASSSNSKSS